MTYNDWYREVSFLFGQAGYDIDATGWLMSAIFTEGLEPYEVLEEYKATLTTSNFSEPA